jgi:glycosyltransferase involved in cell wall biosynthesis
MKKRKFKVLLLGKTPPPYMGPSIATEIILNSSLNQHFKIIHQQTRLNRNLTDIGTLYPGKVLKLITQYLSFTLKLLIRNPKLVIIPISQSKKGFSKDAVFIRIGAFFNKRILVQLRGSNFLNMYNNLPLKNRVKIKLDLQKCYGAIVLGENLRYIFYEFFPKERIFTSPNGANYTFNGYAPEKSDKAKLVYVGNLQPGKGILDVIESMKHLTEPDKVELNIIGQWRDDSTMMKAHEMISKISVLVNIHSVMTGQVKLDFIKSCDILIFPPREPEGHPWVIVEAMAAGLPVITTDKGAITESVEHLVNGYIIKDKSPKELANRIEYLVKHPQVKSAMGKASFEKYIKYYTEESMVKNLKNIFTTALNTN